MRNIFARLVFTACLYLFFFPVKAQNVGINTTNPQAALDINGDIIIRTAPLTMADGITLALDLNSSRFSYYRITGPTADFTLAGIAAGADGRLVTLFNQSGFAMQLNNEDPSAAATDMIVTGTNLNITIINKGIVTLQYDATEQKWIVRSSSKGSTGSGGNWDLNGNDIYNTNIGNVGIGTNLPSTKLTVQTPLNSTGWAHIGGIDEIIVNEAIGGISASIGTATNHAFRIKSNDIGRLHIYSGGEVVVGSNTTGSFGKLTVETLNNSYGISHLGEAGNILATRMGGTSAGIGTFSNTNMRLFCNSNNAMIIDAANGNIGIGTDAPFEKLTVQTLNNTNGISHRGEGGNILSTRMGGTSAGIGTFSNTNMRIFCNGVSAMIVDAANGNVGIGTETTNTYRLSVNGTIRSKEVIVESAWADYVFENNYKLQPLEEVEKFIKQNKHLPNIPSAKEIEQKGLQVGDTQKRLMEKIEELTLYLIEQGKQIKALQKEIEANKKNSSNNF